jgi:uncharacterized SAM-binding protein YcdF (DUF218 family)
MLDVLFYFKKLVTQMVLPPTSLLLLLALGLALWRWRPRWGQVCAWTGLLLLTACCLPATSQLLGRAVRVPPGLDTPLAARAQAVVVLGGGRRRADEHGGETVSANTLERLRYGARLAKERQLPLLLTGGTALRGVPEAELMNRALRESFAMQARWLERRSRDTHENAQYSAVMLREAGIHVVLLVTHDIHQRRSLAEFAAAGIAAVSAPVTLLGPPHADTVLFEQLPSARALVLNVLILHELLGNLVVSLRPTAKREAGDASSWFGDAASVRLALGGRLTATESMRHCLHGVSLRGNARQGALRMGQRVPVKLSIIKPVPPLEMWATMAVRRWILVTTPRLMAKARWTVAPFFRPRFSVSMNTPLALRLRARQSFPGRPGTETKTAVRAR